MKTIGRKIAGVDVKLPTNQIPTRAPTMVPNARIHALTALAPTYLGNIRISEVKTAQDGCSRRSTCVENNVSVAAKPSLIPYRILKSAKGHWSGRQIFAGVSAGSL